MIIPYNFSICDSTIWVLDTKSPFNICNLLQSLQVSRIFEEGKRFLNIGDGNIIVLSKCHFCPSDLLNIISIGLLAMNGYKILINFFFNIIENGINVINGQLNNKIYILSQPVSVIYTSGKCPRTDDVSNIFLWHCRLDHVNKSRINRLTQEKILKVSNCESLPTYEFCLLKKIIKSLFTKKDKRASEILDLIHTDVYGPMNTSARGGYFYFIIFTNDLSRYKHIYLIIHKFESFEMFK